ncbi:transglutaminase family protein [Acinetobacter sp. ANC 4636]
MNKQIQFLLLGVLLLILLAQIAFAPVSLLVAYAVVWLVTLRIFGRQKSLVLPAVFRVSFIVVGLACIYLQYRTFFGVEAGVAFLSLCLYGKALESKDKRDALVSFNFALFVFASLFLYTQAFYMAILVFLGVIVSLLGLYAIQKADFTEHALPNKKELWTDTLHIFKAILFALPFFIILFLFFPRLPPLWYIPLPDQNKAVTGVSDTLSLGDIAELSQSNALAFRIVLPVSSLPPRSELYWRAMVLDHFDGQKWNSSEINQQWQTEEQPQLAQAKRLNYSYLQADPEQRWVMGLEYSVPASQRYVLRQDGSIVSRRPVQTTQPIALTWVSVSSIDRLLPEYVRYINLQLPETDPRSKALAAQLYQESGQQPEHYIQYVLNWYRQNKFSYSLSPGTLQGNRVDQFLFQTRVGFCEHFASSFVVLMRAVGIPARVVVGYQGGQPAPDNQSWEVRQLDAHAWAEVWVDQHWQRIDPTALIAPQRIDNGMQNYLSETHQQNSSTLFSPQRMSLINQLRVWSDYASYQWQSKVVGYDVEQQRSWLQSWGVNSQTKSLWVLITTILSILLLYIAVIVWRNRPQRTQYEKLIHQFNQRLDQDLQKMPEETFQKWMLRLSLLTLPEQQSIFKQLIDLQHCLVFQKKQQHKAEMWKEFALLLKECSIVLSKRRKILSSQ